MKDVLFVCTQQRREEGVWPDVVEGVREVGLALAEYHDAAVRSFVMTLAHRNARELLRRATPTPAR